jgi:hypothetical protein
MKVIIIQKKIKKKKDPLFENLNFIPPFSVPRGLLFFVVLTGHFFPAIGGAAGGPVD